MGVIDFLRSPQRHLYNAGDVTWEWTNRDRAIAGGSLAALAVGMVVMAGPGKAESQPEDAPPVHPVVTVVETE